MSFVHTFSGLTPPKRYDAVPYNRVRSYFCATEDGTFAVVETDTLSPLDTNPASPSARDVTVNAAPAAEGWFQFTFLDAAGAETPPSDPVQSPGDATAYFTVDELRARFPRELSNTSTYTDASLEYWRAYVEERIERFCDVAFVPRTVTDKLVSGSGATSLEIPNTLVRSIVSATDDGSTVDVSDALVDSGSVYLAAGWTAGTRNLTVTYTHGYDEPPLAVKEAAMLWTRELAVKGPITERQTQIATESGASINLATPGLFGSISGLPSVDEVLAEYRQPSFVG